MPKQTLYFTHPADLSLRMNQQNLLAKLDISDNILKPYFNNVKSGDSTNREAVAAKVYWKNMFGKDFVRDRYGPHPNGFLNYGYSILRAYTARAIMDAGLLPSIGLFHRSYYNSFTLADDLMEPYRPFVDEAVYHLYSFIINKKRMVKTNRYNPYNKRDKCDNFNKRYAAHPQKKQKEPEFIRLLNLGT